MKPVKAGELPLGASLSTLSFPLIREAKPGNKKRGPAVYPFTASPLVQKFA